MNFEDQLKELSKKCFEIESQLPMFGCFNTPDNDEQEFRRSLYRLRIEISVNQNIAKKIDELNEIKEDVHSGYDFCPECFSWDCHGECMGD